MITKKILLLLPVKYLLFHCSNFFRTSLTYLSIFSNNHFYTSIIGAGNLAWHLTQALETAGHTVLEIYSQNPVHAKALADKLSQARAVDHLDFSKGKAQVIFLAVPDDAIGEVAQQAQLPANSIIVHTSGSQPLQALSQAHTNRIGVFYPLQTFTKGKSIDFQHIPICIEAAQQKDLEILKELAEGISRNVQEINSDERAVLHIAAVFACNFTNHLWSVAEKLLSTEKIPLDILHPLVYETLEKAWKTGPEKAQTGPAKRGDNVTIKRHLAFLEKDYPEYAEIYKRLSSSIAEKE